MTDSRTFYIEAEIRLEDGYVLVHTESHPLGVKDPETGATIVAYSDSFAFARGEAVAEELGGELLYCDFGYMGPPSIWDMQDMQGD